MKIRVRPSLEEIKQDLEAALGKKLLLKRQSDFWYADSEVELLNENGTELTEAEKASVVSRLRTFFLPTRK